MIFVQKSKEKLRKVKSRMKSFELFSDIIKNNNIKSYDNFHKLIECRDNKIKGDLFEWFTLYLYRVHPLLANTNLEIELYDDISDKLKKNLKLPLKDKGIDILAIINKHKIGIQSKTRRDREKIIPYRTVSTFCGMFGTSKLEKGIFVTDTYNVCKEIKDSDKIKVIDGEWLDKNCNEEFFKNIKRLMQDKKPIYKSKKEKIWVKEK